MRGLRLHESAFCGRSDRLSVPCDRLALGNLAETSPPVEPLHKLLPNLGLDGMIAFEDGFEPWNYNARALLSGAKEAQILLHGQHVYQLTPSFPASQEDRRS
jgi:hypothetical protein